MTENETPTAEDEENTNAPARSQPIHPHDRVKQGASGIPLAIGDHQWLLARAPTTPGMDRSRDKLYDDMTLDSQVETRDVRLAAWPLLRQNYDLTPSESAILIAAADPANLVDAVVQSLIGPEPGKNRQTYSMWVRASLFAAGLDPRLIPADIVHEVLTILIATGRTIPADQYVDTARYQAKRTRVLKEAEPW